MTDETAGSRRWHLRERLIGERKRHQTYGVMLSIAVHTFFWGSLLCSGVAAALGILPLPDIKKWHVGLLSAAAVGLLFALRQARLQARANWRHQQVSDLSDLIDRLDFEVPTNPAEADIAAISEAYRNLRSQQRSSAVSIDDTPARETRRT